MRVQRLATRVALLLCCALAACNADVASAARRNSLLKKRETPEDASESRQVISVLAAPPQQSTNEAPARVYTQLSAGGLNADQLHHQSVVAMQQAKPTSKSTTTPTMISKKRQLSDELYTSKQLQQQQQQESLAASKIKQDKALLTKALRKKLAAISSGVQQLHAAAAATGEPLASSDSSLSFVTSALESDNLQLLAAAASATTPLLLPSSTTTSTTTTSTTTSTTTPSSLNSNSNSNNNNINRADNSFQCPEQFGYYTDVSDCAKYFVCVFGEVLHESCTGGLHFSKELQTCDWPRNVQCKVSATATANAVSVAAASELSQQTPNHALLGDGGIASAAAAAGDEEDEDASLVSSSEQQSTPTASTLLKNDASNTEASLNSNNNNNNNNNSNNQNVDATTDNNNESTAYDDDTVSNADSNKSSARSVTTSSAIIANNDNANNRQQQQQARSQQDAAAADTQRLPPVASTQHNTQQASIAKQTNEQQRQQLSTSQSPSIADAADDEEDADEEDALLSSNLQTDKLQQSQARRSSSNGNSNNNNSTAAQIRAQVSVSSVAASVAAAQGSQRHYQPQVNGDEAGKKPAKISVSSSSSSANGGAARLAMQNSAVASNNNVNSNSVSGSTNGRQLKPVAAPPSRSQQQHQQTASINEHATVDSGSDPQQPSFDEAVAPIITPNGDIHVHDGPGGTFGLLPQLPNIASRSPSSINHIAPHSHAHHSNSHSSQSRAQSVDSDSNRANVDVFVRPVITNLAASQRSQFLPAIGAQTNFKPTQSSNAQSTTNNNNRIHATNARNLINQSNSNTGLRQPSPSISSGGGNNFVNSPQPIVVSTTGVGSSDDDSITSSNDDEEDSGVSVNDASSATDSPSNNEQQPPLVNANVNSNRQRQDLRPAELPTTSHQTHSQGLQPSFSPSQSFRPILNSNTHLHNQANSASNSIQQNFAANAAQASRATNFNSPSSNFKLNEAVNSASATRTNSASFPTRTPRTHQTTPFSTTTNSDLQLISEGGDKFTSNQADNDQESRAHVFFPTPQNINSTPRTPSRQSFRSVDTANGNSIRQIQPTSLNRNAMSGNQLLQQQRRPRPPKRHQIPSSTTNKNTLDVNDFRQSVGSTSAPPSNQLSTQFIAAGERNWPQSLNFNQRDAINSPVNSKPIAVSAPTSARLPTSIRSTTQPNSVPVTSEQPPQVAAPTIDVNDQSLANGNSNNNDENSPAELPTTTALSNRFPSTSIPESTSDDTAATNPELNAGEPFGAVDYESDVLGDDNADRRAPQTSPPTSTTSTTTSTTTTTTTTTTPSDELIDDRPRQATGSRQRAAASLPPSSTSLNRQSNSNSLSRTSSGSNRSSGQQSQRQRQSSTQEPVTQTQPVTPATQASSTSSTDRGRNGRLKLKKINIDHEAALANNRASTEPAKRPESLFATPHAARNATKCDNRVCRLPDCKCGDSLVPNNLDPKVIPQIVLLTFDDAVNDLNWEIYEELFTGRSNPNGCPILATFYVSHEWTDYGQVQSLYSRGHEMASHSITHSFGEKFSKNQWFKEINGQREILNLYGGVKMNDVRGMRAPFLQIGGNKMFEMLYDANFTYDSSMPIFENLPPMWPYTLDYALTHECMIAPCPTKSYPGVWEVGMTMWLDLRGGRCSMGDACSNPADEDGVYEMLMKNFNRHYKSNRAPFGLFYHSAWFNTVHHRRGFIRFMETVNSYPDTFFVTNWQMIQWMRQPTPLSEINSFEPWQCPAKNDLPPPCYHPSVCNVKSEHGTRFMKTCQPCPANQQYPWVGATGFKPVNKQ